MELNVTTLQNTIDIITKQNKMITMDLICEYMGLDSDDPSTYTKIGHMLQKLNYKQGKKVTRFYKKVN